MHLPTYCTTASFTRRASAIGLSTQRREHRTAQVGSKHLHALVPVAHVELLHGSSNFRGIGAKRLRQTVRKV